MNLSKSKFCRGKQCLKMLWLDTHKPELADNSVMNEAVLATGNKVGDLAMGYYGAYKEVPYAQDKTQMLQTTQELLRQGEPTICEASFAYAKNFCSVDILRVFADGVDIIEVKSSTDIHDIYYYDMAYQYYVVSHAGLKVRKIYNLYLNRNYVRQGALDLQQLFTLTDCTEICQSLQPDIDALIAEIQTYTGQTDEPALDIGAYCNDPYPCVYQQHCWQHIPQPSIFEIHGLRTAKKWALYQDGIVTFADVLQKKPDLNARQFKQVRTSQLNLPCTVDKAKIKDFLATLTYPLYYLDFETFQQAIPEYDGVSPYMQIPFQYSLHAQQNPGAPLEHYEHLGKEGQDPRRQLAEQLVQDIPLDVCTLAYNMGFEKGVIKRLAALYPDLAPHLLNIHDHIKDLMVPFQQQAFYCQELAGSYSIKWVLPAVCPGDPELDYHALDGVHNGSEAMSAFADLPQHSPAEIATIRHNLLKYCCLDTLAMVKILEKLREMVK
jgi:hypothetical protein